MHQKNILRKIQKDIKSIIETEISSIVRSKRLIPRSLLSEVETAQLLNISPKTLPVWRHKGKGPNFIKIESSVRYKISDIYEYIKKQTVKLDS